ncbi:LytTR family DNA-binding domain-containing protein [Tenacibaculum sp. 190524A05c]|uniref:LytR/AlgR family response regulator transcription factor n=1 Tax=Tenacibaculum platacis TaxID=3137852 RepID=UPI0032B2B801
MKILIIDDEQSSRNLLKSLIEDSFPNAIEIQESEDLKSGIESIKQFRPQIVLLDIEMPDHSGLEILDFIDKDFFNFEIIFVTAYNEYAIQAFELSAVDYLLKPVNPTKLENSIRKIIEKGGYNLINKHLKELKDNLTSSKFKKIAIPHANGVKFIKFEDVMFFEADRMYTKIYIKNENEILTSKPLKHYTDLLKDHEIFYKPHRSFFINLNYIKEYIRKDGGYIIMDNDKIVSITKEKKQEFLRFINQL